MESKNKEHYLATHFPNWEILNEKEKEEILTSCKRQSYNKGELVHQGGNTCKGLMFLESGQMRAYIVSEEGREVTLFRIRSGETCVLSASCLMEAIAFEILMDAMTDCVIWIVPSMVYERILKNHMELELSMYKAANERFSDVIWTLQQILFFGVDRRIVSLLWEEFMEQKSESIAITHEEIAKLIGSAREVVTRVLKYLAGEGIVALERGKVRILDKEAMKKYL